MSVLSPLVKGTKEERNLNLSGRRYQRCFGRRGSRMLIKRDSVLRCNMRRRTVYKCRQRRLLTLPWSGIGVLGF
jgi:hypothetical protein